MSVAVSSISVCSASLPLVDPAELQLPTLGFVAEADGQIVGASINGVIDGTGWVYELGVRQAWQGQGIGRALLRHTFAMFAANGVRVARLGVDTENATGALELYRSVGMRPVREWCVFEKSIARD